MNKNEVILAVIEAFDNLERMQNELIRRNREIEYVNADVEGPRLTKMDMIAIDYGKRELVDRSLDYWKEVKVSEDQETGVISVEPYDKWANRVVTKVPDMISKNEFFDYLSAELKIRYENEKDKALARFNVGEQE